MFRLRAGARRGALIAAIVTASLLQHVFDLSKLTLLGNLAYFLAGFLALDLHLARNRALRSSAAVDAAGLAALALLLLLGDEGELVTIARPWLILCLFGAVLGNDGAWRRFCRVEWITVVGGMCYSIYLLHFAIISLLGRSTFPIAISQSYLPNVALQIALLVPPIGVVSALYFRLVERPCMVPDWPRRLTARIRRQPAPA